MDGMRAAVDASAMRECGISGGIVAEHLDVKPAPRLKGGTAGEHLDLNWNDFVRLDRLALLVIDLKVRHMTCLRSFCVELSGQKICVEGSIPFPRSGVFYNNSPFFSRKEV
jgi:hypothetical protein